ncbi:glycoside hydrolase family 47 protein [Paracidobacterium acidisoli]|uniref:Glycoside hydrolase family 47 protein n=1 Tax=Paracidobacterium acidisoli TaxID=2303751 RepID=A0A372IPP1_9BACT|nr:glycoside hydrolase family 47 protein [Paracidobacterium acidisoli]MBT9331706.1 glycoside hydrolase family 47 protein [Paracidobacterium acidisoli]
MKMRFWVLFAALAVPVCFAQSASVSTVPMTDAQKAEMAQKVRAECLRAWEGYKKYAWGHDALKPLSHAPYDWYGSGHSLLMTPVDALDTLTLMGLKPQADEARKLIDTQLNLDQDIYVKDFEITIRLLGALQSNYELTGDKRLLELADDLGRRMLPMFDSPTGMPYEYVNLKTGAVRGVNSNPAEVGSLLIEYGMLARLTGKQEYYDKAKKAMVALYDRRSAKTGLVGLGINVETGQWTDTAAGIMGGIDSYYEYLLKAAILFGDKDCERMWQTSLVAINRYLADERPDGLWYGQADMNTGKRTTTYYGALDAFFPALLALGGDVNRAARLEDSSNRMWHVAGIEPDQYNYATGQITAADYPLRPEIIESAYYLYHYTHDAKYLEMGKGFFDAIEKYCRTDDGFAALKNVQTKEKADDMESFFFAETMKYLYLLFAPPSTLDFNAVILNTEAHPMKRALGLK